MSITDELRKYATVSWDPWPEARDRLLQMCDRIDAKHEKAMSRAGQLLADAESDRDYNYANWQDCKQKVLQHNITLNELNARIECLEDELSHCIKLPVDADGVPIHVGDIMESKDGGPLFGKGSFEVRAMRCDECRWEIYDRLGDRYAPSLLRHYHEPTVEDVLMELLDEAKHFHSLEEERDAIAEYAAKLRLAGDGK